MVVKGTEYVEEGQFTLLTADSFRVQRLAIGKAHRWLEERADLFSPDRENVAPVGLLYPGERLWQDWARVAPAFSVLVRYCWRKAYPGGFSVPVTTSPALNFCSPFPGTSQGRLSAGLANYRCSLPAWLEAENYFPAAPPGPPEGCRLSLCGRLSCLLRFQTGPPYLRCPGRGPGEYEFALISFTRPGAEASPSGAPGSPALSPGGGGSAGPGRALEAGRTAADPPGQLRPHPSKIHLQCQARQLCQLTEDSDNYGQELDALELNLNLYTIILVPGTSTLSTFLEF